VRWARKNPKKVHGLVLITYRGIPIKEGLTYDVLDQGTETAEDLKKELQYTETEVDQIDIMSVDVYNLLKDNFGESYEPCAYLGGTGHIKHYKWWVNASIMEKNGMVYGPIGPRTMEYLQTKHHWKKGTYFTYFKKNKLPRIAILLTGLIGDKRMKKTRRSLFMKSLNPAKWFQPLYSQSIGIVQAPDMMENGMPSMCESCPDMCVWEDNLVNSCRLDEYRKFGRLMNAIVYTSKSEGDKRVEAEETAKV
jgi:hypothetical protein